MTAIFPAARMPISRSALLAIVVASLLTPFSETASAGERTFREVVLDQYQRYPRMQVQDVYKLVYQAALGNEHLMIDRDRLRDYLIEELKRIKPDSTIPLVEYLTPDSALVRLNLRRFKALRGDPDSLVGAMMECAHDFKRSKLNLLKYWGQFEDLVDKKKIPFNRKMTDQYYKKITKAKYPAVHHSGPYEQAYAPAYRVILRRSAEQWRGLIP